MLSVSFGTPAGELDFGIDDKCTFFAAVVAALPAAETEAATDQPVIRADRIWFVPDGKEPPLIGDFGSSGTQWNQPGGPGSSALITYGFGNLLDGGLPGGLTSNQLRNAAEEALSLSASYAPLHFVEEIDSGPAPGDNSYSALGRPQIRFGHHYIDGAFGTNVIAHAYFMKVYGDNAANTYDLWWDTVPMISADFDSDLDLDGTDFLTWQTGYGIAGGASLRDGDADGDHDVDGDDFMIWQSSFGSDFTGGYGGIAAWAQTGQRLSAVDDVFTRVHRPVTRMASRSLVDEVRENAFALASEGRHKATWILEREVESPRQDRAADRSRSREYRNERDFALERLLDKPLGKLRRALRV